MGDGPGHGFEHGLHWTIDDASDLFHSCLDIFLQEALDHPSTNDKERLAGVREVLSVQIEAIQEDVKFAKDVKVKNAARFVGIHFDETAKRSLE